MIERVTESRMIERVTELMNDRTSNWIKEW